MPQIRTKDELLRAQWAVKYQSVAEGKQYTTDADGNGENSPFPIHEYFKNQLLGKKVKMLELNAGHALVEQMTADTMTDMKVEIDGGAVEQDVMDWLEEIDYYSILEEAVRDYFGTGYAVQQPYRLEDESVTVANIDPSTWYPVMPTFLYQNVSEARIITPFDEGKAGAHKWYALVERHTIGKISYELYTLENANSLEGTLVDISNVDRLADLKDVETGLDSLAVFQMDRQRGSSMIFGKSVLSPIWDPLQEVSEIQTQIRQERIKHFKAKLAAPILSLQRAENVNPDSHNTQLNSKQLARAQGAYFDVNQEIFPIPAGSTIAPHYIQRDLQSIVLGSNEIDKILGRIASIVGCPRSIFNLDEKGAVHVDTEKRKDRRYIRQILQAQKKAAWMAKQAIMTRGNWIDKPIENVKIKFSSPFDLSQEEVVTLMREMNASADFVSQEEALRHVWPEKTPDERDAMLQEIKDEAQAAVPANSVFNKPQPLQL